MSRRPTPIPGTLIEWSPQSIVYHDPTNRVTRTFESAQDAAAGLGSRSVVVAVSRRSMFVRTLRVPNASTAEVETIVRMRLGELFPLPAHELAFSVDLTGDINGEGRLAVVVAMPAAELRKLHEEMKAAGLRVQSVVPLAYGSVALASTLNLPTAAIVSRDHGGLGIDVIQNGVLRYSRVAPANSRVAAEVCRTYNVAGIPCGDIVASDGVNFEEADVVSAISPLEALSSAWPPYIPTLELPEMVALRLSRARASRQRVAAAVFAAGVLLALYAYFDYADRAKAVRAEQSRLSTSLRRLKSTQTRVETDAKASTAVAEALRIGFTPAQRLTDVVLNATNAAPEGVWLTGLTVERGKQIIVRGTATNSASVATYLENLKALRAPLVGGKDPDPQPLLRDIDLVFANNATIEETPVTQFSISAFPVGNVPLATANTRGARR